MLWTIAVVFLVLWALGFVAFHVTTWFVHLLLLAGLIALVMQLVNGRSTARAFTAQILLRAALAPAESSGPSPLAGRWPLAGILGLSR